MRCSLQGELHAAAATAAAAAAATVANDETVVGSARHLCPGLCTAPEAQTWSAVAGGKPGVTSLGAAPKLARTLERMLISPLAAAV